MAWPVTAFLPANTQTQRRLQADPYRTARATLGGVAGRGGDVDHFQRKCTKIPPKLFDSFSTGWY
jgi:hypothetical protein